MTKLDLMFFIDSICLTLITFYFKDSVQYMIFSWWIWFIMGLLGSIYYGFHSIKRVQNA